MRFAGGAVGVGLPTVLSLCDLKREESERNRYHLVFCIILMISSWTM